jgi:hypothetical protein
LYDFILRLVDSLEKYENFLKEDLSSDDFLAKRAKDFEFDKDGDIVY